jgi:hypothetical protein
MKRIAFVPVAVAVLAAGALFAIGCELPAIPIATTTTTTLTPSIFVTDATSETDFTLVRESGAQRITGKSAAITSSVRYHQPISLADGASFSLDFDIVSSGFVDDASTSSGDQAGRRLLLVLSSSSTDPMGSAGIYVEFGYWGIMVTPITAGGIQWGSQAFLTALNTGGASDKMYPGYKNLKATITRSGSSYEVKVDATKSDDTVVTTTPISVPVSFPSGATLHLMNKAQSADINGTLDILVTKVNGASTY